MKKKNKKKLPGYWLGTRKPTSTGVLQALGIGNALFTSVEGEDLTPEAEAARRNIIPSALGKLSQQGMGISSILSNTTKLAPTAAANAALNATIQNAVKYMPALPGTQVLATAAENNLLQAAPKTVLSGAGKALAGLGAAYSAYGIYNDIANAGDIISPGDIRNTASTNTYTTAGGNQYTQYGGIDTGAIRRLENARTALKLTNLITDLIGLGASGGSLWGLPGMGIGAGLGALVGGIASIAGFGNNSEELEQRIRNTTNTIAMENRQNRSVAESDDVKQAFYGRAAKGKQPVYSEYGPTSKTATAEVSNGEVIGKFKKGRPGVIESQYRVPGPINNKTKFADTKKANVKADTYIVSNQKIPGTGIMLSDYAAATGDILGALNVLNMINLNKKSDKFKCGKKPSYWLGKAGEALLATAPHFISYIHSNNLKNRIENSALRIPPLGNIDMSETDAAINRIAQDKIDDREYLNQSNKTYRQALWNVQRTPGIGFGARAIGALDLARMKFAQDAETKLKINQANWERDLAANEWAAKAGLAKSQMRNENFWRREDAWRQANGAKETALWQAVKNGDISLMNLGGDALRMIQYNQARDQQNKMLGIYQQQVDLDKMRLLKDFPETTTPAASVYVPDTKQYMKLTNPFAPTSIYPQYSMYKAPQLSYPYFKLNVR